MNPSELWTLATHGGGAMLVIAACSLLAIVVSIERALALWGMADAVRRLAEGVSRAVYRGDLAEARSLCERSTTPFAEMLLAALNRVGRASPDAVAAAVERERLHGSLRLRARLWILGTIGAVAPFVGLFGTVVGIMRAFQDMAANPGGGFAIVSAGISEALVATAAGIAVAIEAVVLFNYFTARVAQLGLGMRLAAEEVLELLHDGRPGEAARAAGS